MKKLEMGKCSQWKAQQIGIEQRWQESKNKKKNKVELFS
jgi:hypothetical protein